MTLTAIERMYAGPTGDAYLTRCRGYGRKRHPFWQEIAELTTPESVCEIGVGAGENLLAFCAQSPTIVGVDVNRTAIEETRQTTYGIASGVLGSAAALPFPDHSFDLVFTSGVLIHIPQESLPTVYDELVRVARRHVLSVEYEDTHRRMIPWRGKKDVLWADRFSLEYWRRHPTLQPVQRWELTSAQGFDRASAALFKVA